MCKPYDGLITSTQNKRSQTQSQSHIATHPLTFTAALCLTCTLSSHRVTVFPLTLSGLKPQAPQIAITTSLPLCLSATAAYYMLLNSTNQLPGLWSSLLALTTPKNNRAGLKLRLVVIVDTLMRWNNKLINLLVSCGLGGRACLWTPCSSDFCSCSNELFPGSLQQCLAQRLFNRSL